MVIIGCGGGGAWLAHLFSRSGALLKDSPIVLVDGDRLETRNLDRQFFVESDIGKNKAEALAGHITGVSTKVIPKFLDDSVARELDLGLGQKWVFCCADNHPTRVHCLKLADQYPIGVIIAGNEVTDAEAYAYFGAWKNTPADPRKYYPQLLTAGQWTPVQAAGCVTEYVAQPQTALANYLAIGHAMQLYSCWLDPAKHQVARQHLPIHIMSTALSVRAYNTADKAA